MSGTPHRQDRNPQPDGPPMTVPNTGDIDDSKHLPVAGEGKPPSVCGVGTMATSVEVWTGRGLWARLRAEAGPTSRLRVSCSLAQVPRCLLWLRALLAAPHLLPTCLGKAGREGSLQSRSRTQKPGGAAGFSG